MIVVQRSMQSIDVPSFQTTAMMVPPVGVLKGKYSLEKVSLNRKFFTCIVILDHSFGLNVFK